MWPPDAIHYTTGDGIETWATCRARVSVMRYIHAELQAWRPRTSRHSLEPA